jgi:hypothetical protein
MHASIFSCQRQQPSGCGSPGGLCLETGGLLCLIHPVSLKMRALARPQCDRLAQFLLHVHVGASELHCPPSDLRVCSEHVVLKNLPSTAKPSCILAASSTKNKQHHLGRQISWHPSRPADTCLHYTSRTSSRHSLQQCSWARSEVTAPSSSQHKMALTVDYRARAEGSARKDQLKTIQIENEDFTGPSQVPTKPVFKLDSVGGHTTETLGIMSTTDPVAHLVVIPGNPGEFLRWSKKVYFCVGLIC